jgi:hypothetical protein
MLLHRKTVPFLVDVLQTMIFFLEPSPTTERNNVVKSTSLLASSQRQKTPVYRMWGLLLTAALVISVASASAPAPVAINGTIDGAAQFATFLSPATQQTTVFGVGQSGPAFAITRFAPPSANANASAAWRPLASGATAGHAHHGAAVLSLAADTHVLLISRADCIEAVEVTAAGDAVTGDVFTVAGVCGTKGSSDGVGAAASFNYIWTMSSGGGSVFLADKLNNCFRRGDVVWPTAPANVTALRLNVSTAAGTCNSTWSGAARNGNALDGAARFISPNAVAVTRGAATMFTGSYTDTRTNTAVTSPIRKVWPMDAADASTRVVADVTIAASGAPFPATDAYSMALHPWYNADDNFILYVCGDNDPSVDVYSLSGSVAPGSTAAARVVTPIASMITEGFTYHAMAVLPGSTLLFTAAKFVPYEQSSLWAFTDAAVVPPFQPATPAPVPATPAPVGTIVERRCPVYPHCGSDCAQAHLVAGCVSGAAGTSFMRACDRSGAAPVLRVYYYASSAACGGAPLTTDSYTIGQCYIGLGGTAVSFSQC